MSDKPNSFIYLVQRTKSYPYIKISKKAKWIMAIVLALAFAYQISSLVFPNEEVKEMVNESTIYLKSNPQTLAYFGSISNVKLTGYSTNGLLEGHSNQYKPGYAQIKLKVLGEKAEKYITFTFKKIENNWVLDSSDFSE